MSKVREIKEGLQPVGIHEKPKFRLTTTPWGSAPLSVSVKVYEFVADSETYTDVTATVLPGSVTVSGDVITMPQFLPQAEDTLYRFEIKFTTGGSELEVAAWVKVER